MRRESGGGVCCGELPESIKDEGREGCDAGRVLPWGGSDESRGGGGDLVSRFELLDGSRGEEERGGRCDSCCAAGRCQC